MNRRRSSTALLAASLSSVVDGKVTWDEYSAGFDAFRACMAAHGVDLVDVKIARDEYDYAAPEDAAQPDLFDECYETEWEQVDGKWQFDHADSSDSAEWLRGCLARLGLRAVKSHQQNAEMLWRNGYDAQDCTEDSSE